MACVGTGTVDVSLGEKTPRSMPCNGFPTAHYVENAPAYLPIDITAAAGATGMVAWQVVSLPS